MASKDAVFESIASYEVSSKIQARNVVHVKLLLCRLQMVRSNENSVQQCSFMGPLILWLASNPSRRVSTLVAHLHAKQVSQANLRNIVADELVVIQPVVVAIVLATRRIFCIRLEKLSAYVVLRRTKQ